MKSILIKDTTREEREQIVKQSLWGSCGAECEFCSGCDNRGGGRIETYYQPYIDGEKEIAEINAAFAAPFLATARVAWMLSIFLFGGDFVVV